MDIRITKGDATDRLEIERDDGSRVAFAFPPKGPVPHDVTHYFVEQAFGMSDGFWGKVDRGIDPEKLGAMAKAAGHASAKRAIAPDREFVQIIQAERMVEAFEADLWSSGGSNEDVRAMTASGCEQSFVDVPDMSDEAIERVRGQLHSFRDRWANLDRSESVSLRWPDELVA